MLAPIGLLHSGSNLIWTRNVKWTLQWRPIDPPPPSTFPCVKRNIWERLRVAVVAALSCTRGGRPSLQRCIRPSRLFSRRFRPVFFFFSLSLWQPRIFPKSGGSWHCFLGDDSVPVLKLKILAHWTKISQTISYSPGRNKISPIALVRVKFHSTFPRDLDFLISLFCFLLFQMAQL